MKISLGKDNLLDYLINQINHLFPDNHSVKKDEVKNSFDLILQRTEYCFAKVNNKYFADEEGAVFNHLHADQYAMFLYLTANTLYRNNVNVNICAKVFQLNRLLHGIDAFYEVELPDIFLFIHPLGTVLGRGQYGDYLIVYQRCNVGSNHDIYPVLKEHVTLHPGSTILGHCVVEDNCKIAAGSLLLDRSLEKNSVYIGNPRDFIIKQSEEHSSIWK